MVTCSDDGTVRIWDLTDHRETGILHVLGESTVAFYRDGRCVATGDPGERAWWTINLTRLALDELDDSPTGIGPATPW